MIKTKTHTPDVSSRKKMAIKIGIEASAEHYGKREANNYCSGKTDPSVMRRKRGCQGRLWMVLCGIEWFCVMMNDLA